ncbi:F-box/kelch-repeat protein At3g23880-like [Vicia villosa]|uniref:F-box/kelch-repeat protein At3g23880-like n=1 Tax=Vicia villosa TaxID=3911 RepID=UPI00273BDA6D|nr:F-box/kelch-repeat protein At3g23880-like [Vicia villosa]
MMSLPVLSPDLITEILSWLPVKVLVRSRCVCKQWKSLIFDPRFAKLHLERSPKHTHTLLTILDNVNGTWVVSLIHSVRRLLEHPSSNVNEDVSCRFKNQSYHAIGSTNGLVCLIGDKSDDDGNREEIFIQFWNPTLRLRSKKSPTLCNTSSDFNLYSVHLGFGYDDLGDKYKVVAVFWDHTVQKWEGKVHCMGDSCWRNTLACHDFPTLLRTLIGQFVKGSVNWLSLKNLNCHGYEWENVTMEQLVIFSLDLRKETCRYMLLPDGFGEKPQDEPELAVLRGCLCLYYNHMKTHFVLWEMREFGVQESWTRLVNVSYEHLQLNDFEPEWLLLPVCLSENRDVLVLASTQSWDDVIMYNQKDGRVQHIEFPYNQIWYAYEHIKSLVLPCPHPHPH